mgnify:CR=1 FL=1
MAARRLAVASLLALLVLASPALASTDGPVGQTDVDPDTTLLDVALEPDGDATWTVSYRVRLDDENTTAAFRSIMDDIARDPENYSAAFERRMTRTVRAAENATGREMGLRNLTVIARNESLPEPTGVIVYRFEWTGFAAVDGERLRAGDAIDQLFLDSDTQLSIGWPDDYHLESAAPPTTRSEPTEVVWAGQLDFDAGEPRVVVAPGAPATTPGSGGNGGDGGGTGGGATQLVLIAVVAAILAGGIWLFARSAGLHTPVGSGDDEPEETDDGSTGDDAASTAGGTAVDGSGEEDEPTMPPEELLSNEERVMKLVREAGGRKKQKEVAEELDWTAAKTSQVVGNLRDDGELDAFRLGRENVLRLPGEDPLGPPDDESGGGDGGDGGGEDGGESGETGHDAGENGGDQK